MRNLFDVLFRRNSKPDPRDDEVNALQVKSDLTLERIERLTRLAGVDAQVGAQTARQRLPR